MTAELLISLTLGLILKHFYHNSTTSLIMLRSNTRVLVPRNLKKVIQKVFFRHKNLIKTIDFVQHQEHCRLKSLQRP